VVIAIIAILAAILFPVFAQAKAAAKKTSDLSNTKQLGTAIQIYLNDSDDVYPSAYYYKNDNSSAAGYVHWSGVLQPYVKSLAIFVSPGDSLGGMAPTNFSTATNNLGYGVPGGQTPQVNADIDTQAPRLSYTANASLMGRKRRSSDPANTVSATAVDEVAGTILIGAMTSIVPCINGTSAASGLAFKSHRPANAYLVADNGAGFVGEVAADYGIPLWAISADAAAQELTQCQFGPTSRGSHINYASPYRFGGSANKPKDGNSNYVYADSHAKAVSLAATLNPSAFQWGKRAYSAGGAVVYKPGTTESVN
jgi:type II secretory pathway pseudopilin PulG